MEEIEDRGEKIDGNHYEKKKSYLTEANEGPTQVNHTRGWRK
jgi:hypothetical protein